MDIRKARKFVELERDGRRVLLTLWDSDQISTCIEDQEKKYCESCQGDEALCLEYIEDMKARGYQAREVELSQLDLEESLPKFLQERQRDIMPSIEPPAEARGWGEPGANEDAIASADQAQVED